VVDNNNQSPTEMEILETSRLRLRKLTPMVMDQVFTTMNDHSIIDFLGLSDFESLEKEKERYKKGLQTYNRSFVNFQLLEKETNRVIGGCGFHTWYPLHDRAEIGYGLFYDSDKQKGLMTEAVNTVLDYGFTKMNLHRVEALTATYNTGSLKILEHFNFTFEGTLRQHYNVNGKMEDSVMYSLLKHEYQTKNQ